MNVLNELSKRNTYQPNLKDSQESCERTYRQAIRKLDKNMTYYSSLDLSKLTPQEIYDICNEAAADLALCCELFLKAIYIHEHGLKGENIDTMWENLSRPEVKDKNGNKMYIDDAGVISYIQVDANGQILYDQNGQPQLADEKGNPVAYKSKGRVVKKNGHDLEYLITSVISPESRLLLGTMMRAYLIEDTERHKSVSFIDVLTSKGVFAESKKITDAQYEGWLEQHAQTFIDSRYAGQTYHNIEVAFLYHLATQCKALAQYIIEPTQKQQIKLTEQDLEQVPDVIKQMSSEYQHLLSQKLIKLIIDDKHKAKTLEVLVSSGTIDMFANLKSGYFLGLIQSFDIDEIKALCSFIIKNKMEISMSKIGNEGFVGTCIQLKIMQQFQINEITLQEILNLLIMESKLDYKSIIKSYPEPYQKYMDDYYKYEKYINNYKTGKY